MDPMRPNAAKKVNFNALELVNVLNRQLFVMGLTRVRTVPTKIRPFVI